MKCFSTARIVFFISALLSITPIYAQHLPTTKNGTAAPAPIQVKDPDEAVALMTQMDAVKPTAESEVFDVKDLATLSGRLFGDDRQDGGTDSVASLTMADVKITLRLTDPRYSNFVREGFSDRDGTYSFEYLAPGTYTVQIDNATLPVGFQKKEVNVSTVEIHPAENARHDMQLAPQRVVSGVVYVDNDGDARFRSGKDKPIQGALVTAEGHVSISDAQGVFELRGLPAGRIGMLVTPPDRSERTHVVLDLGSGPVTNRVVNVGVSR
jgi:hypothetical protein